MIWEIGFNNTAPCLFAAHSALDLRRCQLLLAMLAVRTGRDASRSLLQRNPGFLLLQLHLAPELDSSCRIESLHAGTARTSQSKTTANDLHGVGMGLDHAWRIRLQ